MKYPVIISGEVSSDGEKLMHMQPSKLIEEAETLLPRESLVLDLGAGRGRNGFYLSERGHKVASVEFNLEYIRDGEKIARSLGAKALGNRFIHRDMRAIEVTARYDAVIAAYSLQYMKKQEALGVLEIMRKQVKPGGLNIVEAYIASRDQQRQKPDYALFGESELEQIYTEAGWEIVQLSSTGVMPFVYSRDPNSKHLITGIDSNTQLIVREPSKQKTKDALLARAQNLQNSNPEQAELLLHQAESLK